MANSFLGNVVQSLKAQQPDWENMCFVLPNRRAQHFLQKELTVALEGPLILPQSYSIDDFVVAISTLKPATDLEQQQALYQSYCASIDKKDKPNSFETFLGWSTPLLKDLNTIDQYLVDRKDFFSYMSSLHEIRAWGQAQDKIIQDYTAFWKRLPDMYHEFMHRLEESGQTTPGMCYRMSTELLETFLQHNSKTQFVFCGLNALSPSEIFIVRELLTQDRAQVFWDIDKKMLDDELHQAGRFIRSYISTWPEYKQQPFNQAHAHFHDPKSIKVTQVQQQLGQAKEIGDLLAKMDNQQDWSKTAVVLADESLLMPLLYALPPSIDKLNITMGFPLDQHPTAIFINALLKMAVRQTEKGFYFADVESVLSIPETKALFLTTAPNLDEVLEQAKKEHRSYLDTAYIKAIVPKAAHASVDTLFRLNGTPNQWVADMLEVLPLFYDVQQSQAVRQAYSLAVEKLVVLLSQIKDVAAGLHQDFSFSLLRNLYSQLSAGQKLNFVGAPLEGLQILGVLETRAIDFDNVLVAGVNDYKLFWNYMHEGGVKAIKEGEVYALKKLIHKKLKAVKLNWIDIGNLESLNLAKKALHKKNDPVILEKSNENIWFVKNNVIKFSDDDKFISKRIKRSIILKGYVPEIKKFTKNFFKYKKIEGIVFSKCVNKTNFEQLLDHSKKFWKLNNLNKVESLKFASNCYNFYKLKTNSRINEFLKKYNIKDKKNIINGSEVDKVKSLINRINWKELTNGIPVRNHGDFHFENIIFENNKNNFKFIDWRQDFDGVIKYGDIYYDLGKLLHGIIISHELIEKNMFKISHKKQRVNYSFKTKKNFNLIFDFFFNWLKKNNYNQKKTFILTSLIYLNIAPLHHYPYDNLLFYLGKNMLQSVLNDNYQAYIKND